MVLATLVAGQADWLVSGDEDLLVLADRFPILAPAGFVARFLS
jgi:predicted nucleic acid-binding protein